MNINENGINIEVQKRDYGFRYRITDQSEEFTKALVFQTVLTDKKTGFSLKSGKFPSYNPGLQRFFVRGTVKGNDNKWVKVEMYDQVDNAIEALQRMVKAVKKQNTQDFDYANRHGRFAGWGTTAGGRIAMITRSQAQLLSLTDNKEYPDELSFSDQYVTPVVTKNRHFNEHLSQMIGVLNKAMGYKNPGEIEEMNNHYVSQDDAKKALALVHSLLEKAEQNGQGCLIGVWRLITGLRSNDAITP